VQARAHADADGGYLVEDSLDIATCEGAATIGLELIDAPFIEPDLAGPDWLSGGGFGPANCARLEIVVSTPSKSDVSSSFHTSSSR